jgi:hypothetical protein
LGSFGGCGHGGLSHPLWLTGTVVEKSKANPQQQQEGGGKRDSAAEEQDRSASGIIGDSLIQSILQVGEVLLGDRMLDQPIDGVCEEGVVKGRLLEVVHFPGRKFPFPIFFDI